MAVPFFMISCSGAKESAVQVPDKGAYQAVELTVNSNSDRIVRLETELDKANSEINMLRTQNRQLADSYDGMVELFKEHRALTMTLINKVNLLVGPEKEEEKEKK